VCDVQVSASQIRRSIQRRVMAQSARDRTNTRKWKRRVGRTPCLYHPRVTNMSGAPESTACKKPSSWHRWSPPRTRNRDFPPLPYSHLYRLPPPPPATSAPNHLSLKANCSRFSPVSSLRSHFRHHNGFLARYCDQRLSIQGL
jgi:hypothetical protein